MEPNQIELKLDVIVNGLSELKCEFGELKTHVLGMNGGGLTNRVGEIELHIKDCPATEKLEAHYLMHTGLDRRIEVMETKGGKIALRVLYWLSALIGGGMVVWMVSEIGKHIINP
jgi:hypothetical protein